MRYVGAVLDDSIEADSIAKSDDTLKSRKDATGTVLDKAQAAGKAATDAVTDRQGILQQQKDAVTSSLEHVQDTAVTSSKKITDPEQEFQLGLPSYTRCTKLHNSPHRGQHLLPCWTCYLELQRHTR